MKGRGDQQPPLLGVGTDNRSGELRILLRVARLVLYYDAVRIDAELDEKLSSGRPSLDSAINEPLPPVKTTLA
jgi:hypothetical protein